MIIYAQSSYLLSQGKLTPIDGTSNASGAQFDTDLGLGYAGYVTVLSARPVLLWSLSICRILFITGTLH
jgi:hypothetical protein